MAQKEHILTFKMSDFSSETLPIEGLQNVIAVEFDYHNNCLFYADIVSDVISVSLSLLEFSILLFYICKRIAYIAEMVPIQWQRFKTHRGRSASFGRRYGLRLGIEAFVLRRWCSRSHRSYTNWCGGWKSFSKNRHQRYYRQETAWYRCPSERWVRHFIFKNLTYSIYLMGLCRA